MAASRQHKDEKDELAIIQQTDVDAKMAKRSAAALGYLDDPFIEHFVKPFERKPPIINRGNLFSCMVKSRDLCSYPLYWSISWKRY